MDLMWPLPNYFDSLLVIVKCHFLSVDVTALMVIGMIGAFLFILIQLVLLVDFAHAWNERWLGNYEESQSRIWFTGITDDVFIAKQSSLPVYIDVILCIYNSYCGLTRSLGLKV